MVLGILSDTHGHDGPAERAVALLRRLGAEALVHCGDVGSTGVLDALRAASTADGRPAPAWFVWGNTDAPIEELEDYARAIGLAAPRATPVRIGLADRRIAVFHGHGVFVIDPHGTDVLWWWFDSMGFPPDGPARGRWDGDVLLFEKATPMGEGRYRYEFFGDRYTFAMSNKFPGQSEFTEMMRGDYARVA